MHGSGFAGAGQRSAALTQGLEQPETYFEGSPPPANGIFGWRLAQEAGRLGLHPQALVMDVLQRLARKMYLDGLVAGPESFNPDVPAGYTYLGQLIAHDLTFSDLGTLSRSANAGPLWASPALDLDCLYRGGPFRSPMLYQQRTGGPDALRMKLRVGYTGGRTWDKNAPEVPGDPATAKAPQPCDLAMIACLDAVSNATDLRRLSPTAPDVPRQCPVEPLIGDIRNDNNLILSQITVLLHRFHNRIVDAILASPHRPSDYEVFEIARALVITTYRAVVRQDYLGHVLDPEIWRTYAQRESLPDLGGFGRRLAADADTPLPAEFIMAAFRFGHAMVRPSYTLNRALALTETSLKGLMTFRRGMLVGDGGIPGSPIPNDWILEWDLFFPEETGADENQAHLIGPWVTSQFYTMSAMAHDDMRRMVGGDPLYEGCYGGLPFRDLARAYLSSLPNAQHLADRLGIPKLTREELLGDGDGGLASMNARTQRNPLADAPSGVIEALAEDTPLFYYILREAEVRHQGRRLGPLGSAIVAQVVLAASMAESTTVEPGVIRRWSRVLFKGGAVPDSMRDIIGFVESPPAPAAPSRPMTQASV